MANLEHCVVGITYMHIDWQTLFVPQNSIPELIIRGSVTYLLLFVLLRVVVRRRMGALSMTDLLVIVLIADAAQNGMAGEYRSITEGLILCATIVAWSLCLDWLAFHVAFLRDWLEPPKKLLIRDGKLQRRHMREELITEDELMSQLRQHGIEDPDEVKHAYVEPDGQISVVKTSSDSESDDPSAKKKHTRV
jgi:uncharacterized membrane protein YcaP (DUF421 family)